MAAELAQTLRDVALLEGDFTLRSGRKSRYYFDKYLFETRPDVLRPLARELAALVFEGSQRLACPELGAVLLGGAVALETGLPLCIVRKDAKDYATGKAIEGELQPGEQVCMIEDVLTTGGAALAAIEKVRAAGGDVVGLVGVLDREEGAGEALARAGVPFRPLFRRAEIIPSE